MMANVACDEGGVAIRCTNIDCPAQIHRTLLHFAQTMEIDNLGESVVQMLIDNGFVKSAADLYALDENSREGGQL